MRGGHAIRANAAATARLGWQPFAQRGWHLHRHAPAQRAGIFALTFGARGLHGALIGAAAQRTAQALTEVEGEGKGVGHAVNFARVAPAGAPISRIRLVRNQRE